MLHVTNGDSAADLVRSAGMEGDVLPWRDVLHMGPVPRGMSMGALSECRAAFLASLGWGEERELRESFQERNAILRSGVTGGPVILWFEHDLYDQLQLIQILAWLSETGMQPRECFLICIDRYPGVVPFYGLGNLNEEQIAGLYATREPVTPVQFSTASDAWESFTSSDPACHQALADGVNPDLPFLRDAYRRFLQEWPSLHNGLSRTEEHALSLIADGMHDPVELFRAHQASEEAPFMGDWTFWETVRSLSLGANPLITVEGDQNSENFQSARVRITREGTAVLHGDRDALHVRGIDRWYGGYHAMEPEKIWRWDVVRGRLVSPGIFPDLSVQDNV